MSRPLAIIGLDCADPSLVFEAPPGALPHLEALRARGRWGTLASCHPPITVPAWACMTTGQDPGQLGIYGFRNRADHGYGPLALASAQQVAAPRLWDLASQAGIASVALGVPLTYPPKPLAGAMVAGFPTPPGARLTWPLSLAPLLERWGEGPYMPDIENFRQMEPGELARLCAQMVSRRFAVARGLLAKYRPGFFMMVEMATDRLQHALWEPGGPGHAQLARHYQQVDAEIGRLLALLAPETLVLVVSDHGALARQGGLAINQWLVEQGLLRLKYPPKGPAPLSPAMVDWPATSAWAEGGYYARMFLNIAGREPQGRLGADQAQALARRLKHDLEAMAGPDGQPLGNQVLDPAGLYQGLAGVPPDLMLYPGGLAWRASSLVGLEPGQGIWLTGNDTGPDRANHAPLGILLAGLAGGSPLPGAGQPVRGASIYDVFPSALGWLGIAPPGQGPGRAWEWLC